MAEWAAHPFDQVVYRNNIKRAGYNLADILPAPESWVSSMGWFRETGPSLPGFQLAYVACFEQGHQRTTNGGDYLVQRLWFAREDRFCWVFMQDALRKNEFASLPALCRAASYYLLQHQFFRTASSIKQHLTEKARRTQSEDEYVTCTDRQAQTLLLSTYNALTGPRSTSRRIAILEPKIDPAAKLLV